MIYKDVAPEEETGGMRVCLQHTCQVKYVLLPDFITSTNLFTQILAEGCFVLALTKKDPVRDVC